MPTATEDNRELFRRARKLAAAGRAGEAERLFRHIAASDPQHADALSFLGLGAYERGDYAQSERWLRQALDVRPADPVLRQNLALVLKARGDAAGALRELDRAIEVDPGLPSVHLHRGDVLAHLGRPEHAADALARAVALNPELGRQEALSQAPPVVARVLNHLFAVRERLLATRRREAVESLADRFGGQSLDRARELVAVFNGERRRAWDHPLQRPAWMFFPGLEPRAWYERTEFEWIGQAEAVAPDIRLELEGVLADRAGILPYVPEQDAMPERWRGLAGTTDWGSYHLYRGGRRQDEHCRVCPATAGLLECLPLMDAPGHAPEAFFSILEPGTRIPPHVGLANTKLAVHLALVVPEACSITVGGETRRWTEGEVLVFDDSFEHEARNDSGDVRAVLISEIWNPQLTEVEREAVRALIAVGEDFHRHWTSVAEELRAQVG